MARAKKDRVFDLFKSDFKITFFYKPTSMNGDEFYYITLDNLIELRIKVINNTLVIDAVVPITKSYIAPIYDKLVETIMKQDRITVLVSTIFDTQSIHQSCISHNAPIIDDEDYITVSHGMYQKWKSVNENELSKYGFYILSVSEDDANKPVQEVTVKDIPSNATKVISVDESIATVKNTKLDKMKSMLKDTYDNISIESLTEKSIKCSFSEHDSFILEMVDDDLYIKELLQDQENTFNLVKLMVLMGIFESFTQIVDNVYILTVYNAEVCRLCLAKKYETVMEDNRLPVNKLFKQAFAGYGTFKIVV
jgi:hypothetical protein